MIKSVMGVRRARNGRRGYGRRQLLQTLGVFGAAVAMVIGVNSPAMAAGEWSNNSTTLIIRDVGTYVGRVEVAIWTGNQARGNVRARVWADGFSGWTHSENVGSFTTYRGWVTVNRDLPPGSKVCTEGFWGNQSVGLPCVTIVR